MSSHVASDALPDLSGSGTAAPEWPQPARSFSLTATPSRLRSRVQRLATALTHGSASEASARGAKRRRLWSAQRFTLLLVTIDLDLAVCVLLIYAAGSSAVALTDLGLPFLWLAAWFICSSATGAFSRFGEFSSQRGILSSLGLSVRSGTAALAACTLIAVALGTRQSELNYVEVIVALTLISALARILLTLIDPPRVLVVSRQHEHARLRCTAGAIVRHLELDDAQIGDPARLVADISSQAKDFDACAVEVIGDVGLSGSLRGSLGWELRELHASLRFPMDGGALRQRRVHCSVRGGLAVIEISAPARSLGARLAKRTTDLVGSALLIIAFAPLLLMLAIAVKMSSAGPVLYLQERVGKDGRLFKILKFRSMTDGSDAQLHLLLRAQHKDDSPLFKVDNDPRITPVGAVLRRYSLDELPQLFNVFAGSMSLVGPRPQRPAEVALYRGAAVQRLGVRPGMTGLWQVSGRSRLSWEEAQQLDIDYAHNWSVGEDLHILVRTARAVVAAEGAQ